MNGSPEVLWERRTRRETPFAKGGGPQGRGIYRGEYAAPTKAGLQP